MREREKTIVLHALGRDPLFVSLRKIPLPLTQIGAFSAEVPAAETIFPFLLEQGVVDMDDGVRQCMVSAGMSLISSYGAVNTASLLQIFDTVLEAPPPPKGQDVRAFDWRREGAVVFMGSTAKHLQKDDPKVSQRQHHIYTRLLPSPLSSTVSSPIVPSPFPLLLVLPHRACGPPP
jgi:hypothetical protein